MCRTPLSREVYEKASSKDMSIIPVGVGWGYHGRVAGWWGYDPITSQNIENGYQAYLSSGKESSRMTIELLKKEYIIDFTKMTQTSTYGTDREIKRLENQDIEIKGIAGLRIVDKTS